LILTKRSLCGAGAVPWLSAVRISMPDMNEIKNDNDEFAKASPWIHLQTTYDVEAWIYNFNYDLKRLVPKKEGVDTGHGICFLLAEGGEIFLHTTSEGEILLDVTSEAEWVTPVIEAVTGLQQQGKKIWTLPAYLLTQLLLGMSSLIGASRIVAHHDFKIKKYR